MSKSKAVAVGFLLLVVNSGWIWAFPEASLFYVANVLLHIGLGGMLLAALWFSRLPAVAGIRTGSKAAFAVLSVAGVLGVVLSVIGALKPHLWIVYLHLAAGFAGVGLLIAGTRSRHADFSRPLSAVLVLACLLPAGAQLRLRWYPSEQERIQNPLSAPLSMEYEGGGPSSPFFPSASQTNTGGYIPSDFFLDSQVCGECHKDVYEQWKGSMHHFSSFNNQFYRKAIEYMQDAGGLEASKWCAGCHDHAMLFNGMFEKPVAGQIDTPEAQAGLGCVSCHSISHIPDTMGNGGFTINYPPLHDLMASENPVVKMLHNYVVNTAPAAHRRAFLKPFLIEDGAEFCSSCHKVHLDVPVNKYRWLRGFNEYDSWQASGVSGQGARSFYYPRTPMDCADCHMPLIRSDDPGNVDGFVHSHRFPAANTAVPFVNNDQAQLKATTEFLQNGIVSVDIFAVSPVREQAGHAATGPNPARVPEAATSFAVGEEASSMGGPSILRDVGALGAPLDRRGVALRAGETVKIDVVVRTRSVGHFFPGGTVDAFDVWLELQAADADGRLIYWSGKVEDDGKGPVEKGAHFYRSVLLDEHGNEVNKRNAFHARSALYVRLIPPGAADVGHFRVTIPADAKGPVRFTAKLNYRKFSHYYTQFAYAGKPASNDPSLLGPGFDDRPFTFSVADIPANVSGKITDRIPVLPIVVLAEDAVSVSLTGGETAWTPAVTAEDRERWNDYGIGLLLQGDLRAARHAFEKVTEADPAYADGWLNIARALVQEGQARAAKPFLDKAMERDPSLGRIHFFRGLVQKAEGDYAAAMSSFETAAERYPRDRVVLNQMARIHFLRREYEEALEVLDRVARIDPEDLQMHYTRMFCYRGLGDIENAEHEEKLFRRFKADESSQTITAGPRRRHPEHNNERQPIHEHESVELPPRASR